MHVKNSKVWNYGQFWPPQGPLLVGGAHAELYVELYAFLFLNYFLIYIKLIQLHVKDSDRGDSPCLRRARGGPQKRVPEEGKIGCSSTPLTFLIYLKLNQN